MINKYDLKKRIKNLKIKLSDRYNTFTKKNTPVSVYKEKVKFC